MSKLRLNLKLNRNHKGRLQHVLDSFSNPKQASVFFSTVSARKRSRIEDSSSQTTSAHQSPVAPSQSPSASSAPTTPISHAPSPNDEQNLKLALLLISKLTDRLDAVQKTIEKQRDVVIKAKHFIEQTTDPDVFRVIKRMKRYRPCNCY